MSTIAQLLKISPLNKTEARQLLSATTGFNCAQLLAYPDYCLNHSQLNEYLTNSARAVAGEPIAYILAYKEFYSRDFKVTPAVLIPRPETELMVESVLNQAKINAHILDLGTGSGCIAITLKLERPDLIIDAIDYSLDALTIAKQNAHKLQAKINFIHSDWFKQVAPNTHYDVIISNPPYIAHNDQHLANLNHEPLGALTDFADGLDAIRYIINNAAQFLSTNAYLVIEHGYDQGRAIRQLFAQANFTNISTTRDYAKLERFTQANAPQ